MLKIDLYIIKKFLGTFFFTISLILIIVIVFDISEKIDDFLEHEIETESIVKYYLNFIPYFGNLFSHLFIFISAIFFTSKMANNSEIIAILNSGLSYTRLLRPFLISSVFLSVISFVLSNFIIPPTNTYRIDFANKYFKNKEYSIERNIHMQINPGEYMYMESFNTNRSVGYKFSLEKIKNGKLISKLVSNYITFDSINEKWICNQYELRNFNNKDKSFKKGEKIELQLNVKPSEFTKKANLVETMNLFRLNKFIEKEQLKGSEYLTYYLIEKHKRIAFPIAIIILTFLAVPIAISKHRGKIGAHLGIGILTAFSYILFMQISTTFAINSNLSPVIAVWIPNIFSAYLGRMFHSAGRLRHRHGRTLTYCQNRTFLYV